MKINKKVLFPVLILVFILVGVWTYIHQKDDYYAKGLQTITAGFCGNLFKKDDSSFYVVQRDSQQKVYSTTTVDFRGVVAVPKYSATRKLYVEQSGKKYSPEIVPIENWVKSYALPFSFDFELEGGCAPGIVEINGEFNEDGVLVAESITHKGQ